MRIGGSLGLLALAAVPAWSDSRLERPDLAGYLRWGPLRVRPGIELSNIGYDDNILASGTNPVSDFRASWSPKLAGLLLIGDRAFVEFNEKLVFTGYVDNRDQGFVDQRGSAKLTIPLNRNGFVVDGHLNRISELPLDLDDVRPERRENGIRVGWIANPGWRTELDLGAQHRSYAYSDPDFSTGAGQTIGERLDRSEDRGDFSIAYRLFGGLSAVAEAFRGSVEFTDPTPAGASKDSTENGYMLGVDFGDDRPLSGSIRFGRIRIDAEDDTFIDLARGIGEAKLTFRPVGRTTFTLEASRRPRFSLSNDTLYFVHTYASLRVVHYVTRTIGLEAGGTDGKLVFPGGTVGGREDRLDAYSVGLRLRIAENALGRRVEYTLRYGRDRRDSTIDVLDRSRTTIGLGAVLGF